MSGRMVTFRYNSSSESGKLIDAWVREKLSQDRGTLTKELCSLILADLGRTDLTKQSDFEKEIAALRAEVKAEIKAEVKAELAGLKNGNGYHHEQPVFIPEAEKEYIPEEPKKSSGKGVNAFFNEED